MRANLRDAGSVTTTGRWAQRHRAEGVAGMVDRSSRPARRAYRTPRRRVDLRVSRRSGAARTGYYLGMHPSAVHEILTRYGCLRLVLH
ncbi:leucine zipper domain-containing protein [Pseudactinotalea sp. Z1739]|uniref:leucine zipper domain-containing protein n=1 Tax=Pseudactinotalea sp. Z1739 TaxID=3413028 RepID=UPI003C7DAB1C